MIQKGEKKRIVIVTGCDSGFGSIVARALVEKQFMVIAACLTEESAKKYEDDDNDCLIGFGGDLTNSEILKALVK
eukprot:Awhi_evm1s13247